MSDSGRAVWSVVAALSLAGTLWSLAAQGTAVNSGCCGDVNGSCVGFVDNSTCTSSFNGTFFQGQLCEDDSCRPARTGCCEQSPTVCSVNADEFDCLFGEGDFVADAVCVEGVADARLSSEFIAVCATFTATPTATPTDTPTASATPTDTASATPEPTDLPGGAPCVDPVDCMSGNCVDDVCCETECDGLLEVCNLEGMEGTCTEVAAAAPAASQRTLTAGVVALALIGIIALLRRRHSA